jgi:hypothetical protein
VNTIMCFEGRLYNTRLYTSTQCNRARTSAHKTAGQEC